MMTHSHHAHLSEEETRQVTADVPRWVSRSLWITALAFAVLAAVGAALMWPAGAADPVAAASPGDGAARELVMVHGDIVGLESAGPTPNDGLGFVEETDSRQAVLADVELDEVTDPVGAPVTVTVTIQPATADAGVFIGDRVVLYRVTLEDDGSGASYSFADFERDSVTWVLVIVFALALLLVAGLRGLRAMAGLAGSGLLLWMFTLPALLAGQSPLLVALVTGTLILTGVLYLTHGVSLRTTTALLGTLAGMALAGGVILLITPLAHLTGITSEDDIQLWGAAPEMSMSQMVVAAVIITAIGVLNDVTITQSSAVWELAGDKTLSRAALFARAMRIGRDHVASSVYTVAFAVVGAGLTTYLMIRAYDRPMNETLPLEQFSGEVITTVIGLGAVLLAMPLTTWLAALVVRSSTDGASPEPAKAS